MISFVAAAVGLLVILWLAVRRTPAVLASALILFGLTYRIVDVAYLDMFGPVYATELTKFVGGQVSAPFFVAAVMAFVLPAAYMFRPQSLLRGLDLPLHDTATGAQFRLLVLCGVALLLAALYADMLRIGTIPLLTGMDRLAYEEIAGVLHNPTYNLGFLPAGALGIVAVQPRLQGRPYDRVAIVLFLLLLTYWALTGNRFSAFLLAGSFFALPFAAPVAAGRAGLLPSGQQNDPWAALVSAKVLVPIVFFLGSLAVIGLIRNSYFEVRGYADPTFEIFQRVFVQPVQIYASVWADHAMSGDAGFNWNAIDQVLLYPDDPSGNTTMRYLMIRELGYFRAMELISYGTQYAGGFPEIFIELFGVYAALPLILLVGTLAAWIARLVVRQTLAGHILSALAAIYVYFAFNLTFVGGMLNSLIAPSLAAKVVMLVIVMIFERYAIKRSHIRLPAGQATPSNGLA